MNLRTILLIVIGVVGYSVWAVMAYLDPAVRVNFLNFNIVMTTGTIGLVLRDMPTTPTNPAPPTQLTTPLKEEENEKVS